MDNTPNIFRVVLEVSDLAKAVEYYSEILALEGRMLRGSRAYFGGESRRGSRTSPQARMARG